MAQLLERSTEQILKTRWIRGSALSRTLSRTTLPRGTFFRARGDLAIIDAIPDDILQGLFGRTAIIAKIEQRGNHV